MTLGFVAGAAMVGYQLYYLPLLRNTYLYILGALVIWWFSVSGVALPCPALALLSASWGVVVLPLARPLGPPGPGLLCSAAALF